MHIAILLLFSLSTSSSASPASVLPTPYNAHLDSFGVPCNASFNYVVIGGGTAGLAVAANLATGPSITVAVIEAGGFYEVDNGNISVIPGYATFFTGTNPNDTQPLVDWGFDTVPQAVCLEDIKGLSKGEPTDCL